MKIRVRTGLPGMLGALPLLLCGAPAQALITCDQLVNVAYSTQQARDKQGASLRDVLAEAEKLQKTYDLTATELEEVKAVITATYGGMRDWKDVMNYCKKGADTRR
jgi:hypothetical protein